MFTVTKVSKKLIAVFLACLLVFIALPFSSSAAVERVTRDNAAYRIIVNQDTVVSSDQLEITFPVGSTVYVVNFLHFSSLSPNVNEILENGIGYGYDPFLSDYITFSISNENVVVVDTGYVICADLGGSLAGVFYVHLDNSGDTSKPLGVYVSAAVRSNFSNYTYGIYYGVWSRVDVDIMKDGLYRLRYNNQVFDVSIDRNFSYDNFLFMYTSVMDYIVLCNFQDKDLFYFTYNGTLSKGSGLISSYLLVPNASGTYYIYDSTIFNPSGSVLLYSNVYTTSSDLRSNLQILDLPTPIFRVLNSLKDFVSGVLSFDLIVFEFITGSLVLPWVLIGVVVSLISFLIYKTKGFTRL